MQANLAIQLSDSAFTALSSEAALLGKTPSELAAHVVETAYAGSDATQLDPATARQQFEQCFGSVDLGHPIGIDNDGIDDELASEYQSNARRE